MKKGVDLQRGQSSQINDNYNIPTSAAVYDSSAGYYWAFGAVGGRSGNRLASNQAPFLNGAWFEARNRLTLINSALLPKPSLLH